MRGAIVMSRALLLIVVCLASPASWALTTTSGAAGFAGTLTQYCFSAAGNFEIEVLYNTYLCERRGVIEFDVSGTGVASVSSAVVSVFDGAVGNSERRIWPIDVYGYIGDGVVSESDFGAGSYVGTYHWNIDAPSGGTFQFDLTSYVNGQLGLGTSIIGLNLRPNDPFSCYACSNAFIYFDGAGGDDPPTLELQAVPLPGTALLCAAALGWLVPGVKRRGQPVHRT